MNDVIEQMKLAMTSLDIDYYYMYNNSPTVTYPYCTGEYTQADYVFEDNSNRGDFLLELWSRTSQTSLLNLDSQIKNYFRNLHVIKNNTAMVISYASSMPVATNEASLFKQEIHLDVSYWEGV